MFMAILCFLSWSTTAVAFDTSDHLFYAPASTPFQQYGYSIAAINNTIAIGTNTLDGSSAVYIYSRMDDTTGSSSNAHTQSQALASDASSSSSGTDDDDEMIMYGAQERHTHTSMSAHRVLSERLWSSEPTVLVPNGPIPFTGFGSALAMCKYDAVHPTPHESMDSSTGITTILVGSPFGGPREDGQVYFYSSSSSSSSSSSDNGSTGAGAVGWNSTDYTTQMMAAGDGQYSDMFGYSVSLSTAVAAVGAPNHGDNGDQNGAVYVYMRNAVTNTWMKSAKVVPSVDMSTQVHFGTSIATLDYHTEPRYTSTVVAVGAPGESSMHPSQGAVYLYTVETTGVTSPKPMMTVAFLDKLVPTELVQNAQFGISIALSMSDDGVVQAVVGAVDVNHAGAIYVYLALYSSVTKSVSTAVQRVQPHGGSTSSGFGYSLAFHHNLIIVGAPHDDSDGHSIESGAVYVYTIMDNSKIEMHSKLTMATKRATSSSGSAVSLQSHANYGQSVVILGDSLYVGVPTGDMTSISAAATAAYTPYTGYVIEEAHYLTYGSILAPAVTSHVESDTSTLNAILLTAMLLFIPGILVGSFVAYKQNVFGVHPNGSGNGSNTHVMIPVEDLEEGGVSITGMGVQNTGSGGGKASGGGGGGASMMSQTFNMLNRNRCNSLMLSTSESVEGGGGDMEDGDRRGSGNHEMSRLFTNTTTSTSAGDDSDTAVVHKQHHYVHNPFHSDATVLRI